MAAQGKTDPEICGVLFQSHRPLPNEILIHIDLPSSEELEHNHITTWGEEALEEPFELSTPLCNFASFEKELLPAIRDFLHAKNYVFVVITPNQDGDIMNFCRAPPDSKEFTDKQDAILSYMTQHKITEIRPTEEGLKIWHESGMIENIPFQPDLNLNYPRYKEQEEVHECL